jgi:CheY-like chemotaxis protein
MVCRSIKHSCEDIMEAGDGVQAVAVVRQSLSLGHPIDVVFMDYEMPEMDGPTAAAAMRRIGYTGAIIGITGNTLKHSRDHFLSHGADRVLSKPVEMQVLRQILSGMHTAIDTCLSTFVANNLLCPCLLLGRPTS